MARRKWEYLIFVVHDDECYTSGWNTPTAYFDVETDTKYEYASIEDAGLDGWELVSVDNSLDRTHTNWVFKRETEETKSQQDKEIKLEAPKPIECDVPLEELNLPTMTYNALVNINRHYDEEKGEWVNPHDIFTVGQVLNLTGSQLFEAYSFGSRSLEILRAKLKEGGFASLCPPYHWVNNGRSFSRLG